MTKVSAKDRTTLEEVYPADTFASDAAQNELPGSMVRGVRIDSAPDDGGAFDLERAVRHAGEPETSSFLAPQKGQDYRRFLDDIVVAAHRFGYRAEESPGPGDARIKGLRQ